MVAEVDHSHRHVVAWESAAVAEVVQEEVLRSHREEVQAAPTDSDQLLAL